MSDLSNAVMWSTLIINGRLNFSSLNTSMELIFGGRMVILRKNFILLAALKDECKDFNSHWFSVHLYFWFRIMALFVASHYKNSPNDLQMLSDAPAHHIFCLLGPISENSTSLPEVRFNKIPCYTVLWSWMSNRLLGWVDL